MKTLRRFVILALIVVLAWIVLAVVSGWYVNLP
jgi:hypothetical protein